MVQHELMNSGFSQILNAPRDESFKHGYSRTENFMFSHIFPYAKLFVCLTVTFCLPWQASSQNVTFNGFSTGYSNPLQTAAPFIIDVGINYPGSSITVNFYLTNSGTQASLFLTNAVYRQPSGTANIPQSLELPFQCFMPSNGWQILPVAVGHTLAPSLSTVFSIIPDHPSNLTFGTGPGGNTVIISSQQFATASQTNLTITNAVYFQVFLLNTGCATSANDLNYTIETNGLVYTNGSYYEPITGGTTSEQVIPFSSLRGGTQTITLSIVPPNPAIQTNITFFIASPPVISVQPFGITTNVGGSATFSVTFSGEPFPSFQWRFNGATIAGATNDSYTINNVQMTNAGSYSCFVQNYAGSATSSNAILQVTVPLIRPTITSFRVHANEVVMLTVTGAAGSTNVIQNSTNLLNWNAVRTNINTTGTFSAILPLSTQTNGYYRVLLQ